MDLSFFHSMFSMVLVISTTIATNPNQNLPREKDDSTILYSTPRKLSFAML